MSHVGHAKQVHRSAPLVWCPEGVPVDEQIGHVSSLMEPPDYRLGSCAKQHATGAGEWDAVGLATMKWPHAVVLVLALAMLARDSGAERTLPDYRYFRALSIDVV